MKNLPIGEVLKEYGYITQEQIDQALQFQKTQTGKKVRFGTLLKEMGFVTETQVLEALGKKLDLQMVNLEEYEVNVDVVAKVPKQLAEKYNVIALSENDGKLQLAMSDPLNFYAQEDIRQIVDMPLEVLLSEKSGSRRQSNITTPRSAPSRRRKKRIFPPRILKCRSSPQTMRTTMCRSSS